ARVKLAIVTSRQRRLLASGKLRVRVRATGRARRGTVALAARRRGAGGLVRVKRVRLRGTKPRVVGLRLTARGREALGACGAQRVKVRGAYRLLLRGGGKPRRGSAAATRRLARDPARCGLDVPAPNADRCDPIDLAHCLAPFPNDYYTVPDPETATGLRVNIHPDSAPTNVNGLSSFHPDYNRNDGFSPNNVIAARVPGIETPEAFKANGLVPQMDIGAYADPGQRLVLINAETGERHPIWAELDMVPGTPNPHNNNVVQGTEDDRLLLIHPAVALDYGTRYIVAFRDLTDEGGAPLAPNPAFAAYRDGIETVNPAIEARRPAIEELFAELADAGIEREGLYLAWDFTVASERNLTERLVAMRDDAFAQLGDTDLADGEVSGDAPAITITGETEYELCAADGNADECELDSPEPESDYAFKKVTGTIEVPCYMNAPGPVYNPTQPGVPCSPGSRLHYEGGADVPSQNADVTWEAPFTCIIPRTGRAVEEMATGKPGIVFGHGLLQNNRVVEQLGLFPGALEGVACGTDWIGLSAVDPITGDILPEGDLAGYMLNMIAIRRDLSLFSALPDRSQQGFVNTLYLARAMAHPDGLGSLPEFEGPGAEPALAIDPDDTAAGLAYHGVSLGGIFGGATTAVAPDWERAVLSVPGIGFTTLLTRSTQFNQFLPLIYSAYPDPLARQIGISLLQLVWDRGEPSAYSHLITDEPPANTPPHRVMIHEAFGDHQVANVQTETLARTLEAAVRVPVLAPGRLADREYVFADQVEPFYVPGQQLLDSSAFNVPGGFEGPATIFTLDTGPISPTPPFVGTNPNPDWNIAPVGRSGGQPNDGLDPHAPAATSPAAQQMAIPFLLGLGAYDACVDEAPGPDEMPPWGVPSSGEPEPCSAPPVHSPGQGQ
ncbi:MAG TPA: hypothetical protein VK919_13350, partial [Solirubrobacterales bacterium]|nr:hypothetical protein [Solirubrobacterales bacterium]